MKMNIDDFICSPLQWPIASPYLLKESSELYSSKRSDLKIHQHIESISSRVHMCLEPVFFDPAMRTGWEEMGIVFLDKKNFDEEQYIEIVRRLFDILAKSSSLHSTVSAFAKYFHPLASNSIGYDTSLSDPELPFSIFSTIPTLNEKDSVYRFTESIVHESLHLQLTAIEMNSPLFEYDKLKSDFYSPWKGEGRTEQGLLHAIYVFSNIKSMWEIVHDVTPCIYLENRINMISKQLGDSLHIFESKSLTTKGSELLTKLL